MTCERQCEANWGVHLAFYFGQPRIVQHSPSFQAGGVAFFWGSGVSAGESGVMGDKTPLPKTLVPYGFVALVA